MNKTQKEQAEVDALKSSVYASWDRYQARQRTALTMLLSAAVLGIGAAAAGTTDAVPAAVTIGLLVIAALTCLVGGGFLVDSIRQRFRAESINEEILRRDPHQSVVSSWPEEFGNALRERLNNRRGSRGN